MSLSAAVAVRRSPSESHSERAGGSGDARPRAGAERESKLQYKSQRGQKEEKAAREGAFMVPRVDVRPRHSIGNRDTIHPGTRCISPHARAGQGDRAKRRASPVAAAASWTTMK